MTQEIRKSYGKLHHVGVVVRDINKAIAYFEALGIGPFTAGPQKTFAVSFKGELHGRPAEWTTTISNAELGGAQLELLEPTEGDQALKESLDQTGEGLDAEIANFKSNGVGIWTKGAAAGGPFIYSDPTPTGGIAIEFREIK
jgi:methylmalonyl-CoA/ethylmalonyl-CoA epimerase